MYLTHMSLNPQRRSTRELIDSPQRLHAAVLSAFVPGTADRGRILWRLDTPEKHRLDLFLLSPEPPSLEALVDQAGWPAQPVWRTADYSPLLDALEAGQRWVFRLRANPTKSVRSEPRQRGTRVHFLHEPEQRQWLVNRSAGLGFVITEGKYGPNVRVTDRRTAKFRRGGPGGNLVTLGTAAFEGVLEVKNPRVFRDTLLTGIGPAKGYGCGLLTLARPR